MSNKNNLTGEEKTIRIRKDLIKNVAIVFLSIMLLLTFFSNSIMNKSLPEVATEYLSSGSVAEAVRGQGIVTAEDPYSVVLSESRTVKSVAVSPGDIVEKDQVIMYLEDKDSAELEEAKKALDELVYNYTVGALSGDMSDAAYKNATNGNIKSMDTYEAEIEDARRKVKAAQDNVDSIARQQAYLDEGTAPSNKQAELDKVKDELTQAEAKATSLQAEVDSLRAVVEAGKSDQNAIESVKLKLANTKAAYNEELQKVKGRIEGDWNVIDGDGNPYVADDWNKKLELLKARNAAKYSSLDTIDKFLAMIIDSSDNSIKDADALNDVAAILSIDLKDLTEKYNAYNDAKSEYESLKGKDDQYAKAQKDLNSKEGELNRAKNTVSELQTKVNNLSYEMTNDTVSQNNLLKDLSKRKADADLALQKAKDYQTQLLLDISKTLDLANQNSIIRDQQKKIEELQGKAIGATVVAPVAGTIISVNKTAGETTTPEEAVATIQVEGKGMTLSFSVSNEQAKKISMNSEVTIQNNWYYEDAKAVLSKIIPDPENPGKQKKLIFNITGSLSNGESLSLSVGERSRNYDYVVPNSAVREDKNGKFILIIEEKATPFGNRYKARRLDVEVLAKDDNRTAVGIDGSYWGYVITTSNKPVESGMQVRLAEN